MRMGSVLVLALSLGALSVTAQEAKAPAAPAMPPAPKPGPEMEKLKSMIGTWQVAQVVEPGVMGPGGKGHGTGTVRLGPGGFSLLIDYVAPAGPLPAYRGHGMLAWDAEAKAYKQAWADNMGPMLMNSTGNWEGDTLVMVAEGTMMGKPFKSRDTISAISKDGYTLTSEFSMDGGPMKKFMTLVHTRAKAKAPK